MDDITTKAVTGHMLRTSLTALIEQLLTNRRVLLLFPDNAATGGSVSCTALADGAVCKRSTCETWEVLLS